MNNPEYTVVPTKAARAKNGPLSASGFTSGIAGIRPFSISTGGGIRIKKFTKKQADIIATITARLRSKNSVFPFQNMKKTRAEKAAAK